MKRLMRYIKGYEVQSILAPLFKLFEALMDLLVPIVVARIIDDGIAMGNIAYVWKYFWLLILLAALGLAFSITAQWFAANASVGFATALRKDLFLHVQSFSYSALDKAGTDTLITRMTSDVNLVQSGVNMALRLLLRSPFIVVGAMIMSFTIDVKCALVFAVAIPLLSLVVAGIMYITIPLFKKAQAALDKVLGITRENLTGVRVIRAFCKEEDEIAEFDEKNRELTRLNEFVGRISALMNPVTFLMVNVATIFLIKQGAVQVNLGILKQGDVVAMYNYMAQMIVELIKFASLVVTINKGLAGANRVADVFEIKPGMEFTGDVSLSASQHGDFSENGKVSDLRQGSDKEQELSRDDRTGKNRLLADKRRIGEKIAREEEKKKDNKGNLDNKGNIDNKVNNEAVIRKQKNRVHAQNKKTEDNDDNKDSNNRSTVKEQDDNLTVVKFDNVSFAYNASGEEAVSGLDFVVNRGQTVGIIGATGSGKSTLVNLIPRFYDATSGEVIVDGKNVKDYEKDELLSKFGIVPQKAVLFEGTIRDNLRWGNENATDKEIWKAIDTAQATEVVKGKKEGLDYYVEQNGRNLSGGQKQRLTIARALIKKPGILILDDSASALDFATDAKLRSAIAGLDKNMTVFIVSQRTSSIRNADNILVMDDGRIVGQGTHDELMKSCGVYQEIYYSQFPEEKNSVDKINNKNNAESRAGKNIEMPLTGEKNTDGLDVTTSGKEVLA